MTAYEQCVTDASGRCVRWSHDHADERCASNWCGPWRDGLCIDCGHPRGGVA